jgi:hypothetical protein
METCRSIKMSPKKVNEIMSKVLKEWINRYGVDKLDPKKIKYTRKMLLMSPHEDGFMRVELIEEDGAYLVPFEDIILNGLKGEDIPKKYAKETINSN